MIREGSIMDLAIRNKVNDTLDRAFAPNGWGAKLIRRLIRWRMQGYELGYTQKEREAFTWTVANRLRSRSPERVWRLFGVVVWFKRHSKDWCWEYADNLVTEWLKDERIKFGDPAFDWTHGHDLADEDLQHWEAV